MLSFYLRNARFLANITLLILTLVLLGYILKLTYQMIFPFIIGTIISLIIEPFITKLQKHSISRTYSVLIVILFIVIFSVLLSFTLISGLTTEVNALIKEYPLIVKSFQDNQHIIIDKISDYQDILPPEVIGGVKEYTSKISHFLIELASETIKNMFSIITSIPDRILIFVIIIMYVFFFSKDLTYFKAKISSYIPNHHVDKVELIVSDTKLGLLGYIKAQVIIAIISGLMIFFGLLIIKSKYILTISTMCLLASFIPFLGVNTILIPWTIYSAIFFPKQFTIELIVIIVVVTIMRHIIEPKILGDKLGIKPIGILVASFIGFQMIGFLGLIIGPIGLIIANSMLKSGLLKSILIDE